MDQIDGSYFDDFRADHVSKTQNLTSYAMKIHLNEIPFNTSYPHGNKGNPV